MSGSLIGKGVTAALVTAATTLMPEGCKRELLNYLLSNATPGVLKALSPAAKARAIEILLGDPTNGIFDASDLRAEPSVWREALVTGDQKRYLNLKAAGVTFEGVDGCGRTALHLAAIGGNVEILRDLLTNFALDINAQDMDGDTPILTAVSNGRVEAIRFLRDFGADLTIKPPVCNGYFDRLVAFGLDI